MIQSIGLFPSIFWGMTTTAMICPIFRHIDLDITIVSPWDHHSIIPQSHHLWFPTWWHPTKNVRLYSQIIRIFEVVQSFQWDFGNEMNHPWHGVFSDGVFLAVGDTPWRGAAIGAFDLARSARSDSRAMSISWWWNPPPPSRDVHGISPRREKIWSCSRLGNDGSSMMVGSHDGFIMEFFTMMVGC